MGTVEGREKPEITEEVASNRPSAAGLGSERPPEGWWWGIQNRGERLELEMNGLTVPYVSVG